MYCPNHIYIENVAGICTASCGMCPIESSPRKGIMSYEAFEIIVSKLLPIKDHIKMVTFVGLGESLLDKHISEKILLLNESGFSGIGLVTNATALNEQVTKKLIDNGLDTIIISIDGIDANTHETIRPGTKFDSVVKNAENFIQYRNINGKTKVIIRMIKQELNSIQTDDYFLNWNQKLNKNHGDMIAFYDMFSDPVGENEQTELEIKQYSEIHRSICDDIVSKFMIQIDGGVVLCCAGGYGVPIVGNIFENDLLEIYNNHAYEHRRQMMLEGRMGELEHCKSCKIFISKNNSQYIPVS